MEEQNGIEELLQKEVRDAILSELTQFRAAMNGKFERLENEVKEMFAAMMCAEDQDE